MTYAMHPQRMKALANALILSLGALVAACVVSASRPAPATAANAVFTPTVRVEDDDPRLLFTSGWKLVSTSAASGLTRRVATQPGAYARLSFRGTGAAVIARRSPTGGRLEVSVDGGAVSTVNLVRATTSEHVRVWTFAGLAPGVHHVRVRAVTATDTTTWQGPWLDGFDVEGTPLQVPLASARRRIEESDRRIRYLGNWRNRAPLSTASAGKVALANSSAARAVVAFDGTGIAWLAPNQAPGTRVQVLLDGKSQGYVTMNRAGGRNGRKVMWAVNGLRSGKHTLVLRATTKPLYRSRMAIDTFEVDGSVRDAVAASSFGYSWSSYVVIDKSDFRLYLVKGGVIVRTYPVAHGRSYWPTPSRVWRVGIKYYTWPGSVYGPRKMRLFKRIGTSGHYSYVYSRYAMHGTNQPWVIGTLASHGCIRLYNDDVLDLFPRVPVGIMVVTRD